jgi:hypothetical protein
MKILLGDFNTKLGREDIFKRESGNEFYIRIIMTVVLEQQTSPQQKSC